MNRYFLIFVFFLVSSCGDQNDSNYKFSNYHLKKDSLEERATRLHDRLNFHKIDMEKFSNFEYFNYDDNWFINESIVGKRIIILNSLPTLINYPDDKEEVVSWFKKEGLWDYTSKNERKFLKDKYLSDDIIYDISWGIECAYILGWTVGLTSNLPPPTKEISDLELIAFFSKVPELNESIDEFLDSIKYRNKAEIYDENLFNELVTSHLRDCFLNGTKSKTDINVTISWYRHYSLNWLRKIGGNTDWDEVDTST